MHNRWVRGWNTIAHTTWGPFCLNPPESSLYFLPPFMTHFMFLLPRNTVCFAWPCDSPDNHQRNTRGSQLYLVRSILSQIKVQGHFSASQIKGQGSRRMSREREMFQMGVWLSMILFLTLSICYMILWLESLSHNFSSLPDDSWHFSSHMLDTQVILFSSPHTDTISEWVKM